MVFVNIMTHTSRTQTEFPQNCPKELITLKTFKLKADHPKYKGSKVIGKHTLWELIW